MIRPLCLSLAASLGLSASAGDWTSWRGPEQNGVSRETGLPERWTQEGENLVWKTHEVFGRSTPVVMDGRVYVLTGEGQGATERERLVCMDADDGRILWQRPTNVFLTDIPGTRLGWPSPVADPQTGYVFVHFTSGIFAAFDRDGAQVWSRSLTEEYNRISGYGGRLMTPIVDGDLVIISFLNATWGAQARGSHRFVAFDKRTGEVVWWSQPGGPPLDTTYSIPVVAEIDGTRQLIAGLGDGTVAGMKVGTGEPIWSFKLSKRALNVSPVVDGTRVYIGHSEENYDTTVMGRVVCIDATGRGDVTQTHEVWRVDGLGVGYASPTLHDGRLYVLENNGNLHCLDAQTGRRLWHFKIGRVAKGSPVLADGKIYVTEVNARFLILRPGDTGCELLDEEEFTDPRFPMIDVFGSPAVANGRVYFTTMHGVYCIGSREPRPAPTPQTPGPPQPAPSDARPAALLVHPADVLLAPGATASFEARLYDDRGRFIRATPAAWSTELPDASVNAAGRLAIPADARGAVGLVTAEANGVKGAARIRVAPRVPFAEDFESIGIGKAPPHWIGAAPKFAVAELDGQRVLHKKADDPRSMRADLYMAAPDSSAYTIQADVAGGLSGRNRPDVGVLANRYRFELKGNTRTLRLVTWVPMPRLEKEIPFDWEPHTWYTLKLRVDVDGERARVRGKVWRRGESEPGAWTLEMEDPIGNACGSPGLYGFSMADIYYDNVIVTAND